MTGSLINAAAIVAGGFLGLLVRTRLSERTSQAVVTALGLFTLAYGFQMFTSAQNSLIVLGSLLMGVVLGEWLQIENGVARIGGWLERRFMSGSSEPDLAGQETKNRFVRGFLSASILFAIGPMAILGSIQDGLTGDTQLLLIKSTLDFFGALAFAASLGPGVLFSAVVVLVYQGTISLLALSARTGFSEAMIAEMTAVGGVIMIAIAISSLLEIRPIRAGNFLPALLLAPALVWLLARF